MSFTEIPVLDLSLARDEGTKSAFLNQLRNALLHVGFLYLKNTGLDQDLLDRVCEQGRSFFDLPDDEKLRIEMKNKPSFLGYSKVRSLRLGRRRRYKRGGGVFESLSPPSFDVFAAWKSMAKVLLTSVLTHTQLGNEMTAMKADWREQYDLSTELDLPVPGDPLYYNLLAPNQWPSPDLRPDFRSTFQTYMRRMADMSTFFTSLIAEAIGLPATAFDAFFDRNQQHKLKVCYRAAQKYLLGLRATLTVL